MMGMGMAVFLSLLDHAEIWLRSIASLNSSKSAVSSIIIAIIGRMKNGKFTHLISDCLCVCVIIAVFVVAS